MKVIIIGGVAGGASAAARIRRLDETAQIIVLERSNYVSYANCGLPYFIGGVIREQAELTLQTPQSFWERFHIDVRVRNEAVDIDVKSKTVAIRRLDTGEIYHEQYDKLLLSPGAKPVVPHLPGVTSDRIFSLRTVEDTLRIRKFIEEYHSDSLKTSYVVAEENKRGVHTVDAGKSELILHHRYKKNAEGLQEQYPRTAEIYFTLSDIYKREADFERKRAEDEW